MKNTARKMGLLGTLAFSFGSLISNSGCNDVAPYAAGIAYSAAGAAVDETARGAVRKYVYNEDGQKVVVVQADPQATRPGGYYWSPSQKCWQPEYYWNQWDKRWYPNLSGEEMERREAESHARAEESVTRQKIFAYCYLDGNLQAKEQLEKEYGEARAKKVIEECRAEKLSRKK